MTELSITHRLKCTVFFLQKWGSHNHARSLHNVLFQINGVQALAKCTGWQMLSSSTYHLGCGVVEPLGNAAGCLLSSPHGGDKFIAVRHSPQTHTSVYIASAPSREFFAGSIVKDIKWENLPESFQELKLEKMDGKNLLNKLELLMAALSHPGNT